MARLAFLLSSAALLHASLNAALPSPIHQATERGISTSRTDSHAPTSIAVGWYQEAQEATSTTCGLKVSEGTLKAGTCYTLHTEALGIQQTEGFDCVFKMWSGVSDCSGNNSWTETIIPSGNATTCIVDHVLDGGTFTHVSGIYSCP